MEIIRRTRMLKAEEVREDLDISVTQLNLFKKIGILNPIFLGKGWKYSQQEILDFQRDYAGLDVSNPKKAMEAKKIVDENKRLAISQFKAGEIV